MARKKTNEVATKKVAKTNVSVEEFNAAMERAGKSGCALKKSTVENAGLYPIVNKENGASYATRLAVYCLAVKGTIKNISGKIKPETVIEMLNSNEFVPVSALVNEQLGKEWRNLGKLKSMLKKEVREGTLVGFGLDFDGEEDFKAFEPKLKKILA